jgi:hypothetical protein
VTEIEVVAAATAKLLGEFYVGQRVRIRDGYSGSKYVGREATVIDVALPLVFLESYEHPLIVGSWHKDWLEPV